MGVLGLIIKIFNMNDRYGLKIFVDPVVVIDDVGIIQDIDAFSDDLDRSICYLF